MLTTTLVVLTILIPLTLVTTAVVKQGRAAVDALHDTLHHILDPDSAAFRWLDQHLDLGSLRDPKVLMDKISNVTGPIANRTFGILGGALGAVIQVFFVLFTLYYLLRDSERIIPAIRNSLPLSEKNADVIFTRTGEVISASVNGVLVIAAIQGFLGMLAFIVLQLPSALLWGVVMFLLSTIPMAGAFLVWGPAAIYLAVTGHLFKAIALTIWGAGVIGMIDNVLRPRLVGKRAKLHELIIFFSVMGGLQVFGVLGLFVGPVVAAIALALLEVWSGERRSEITDPAPRLEVQPIIDPEPPQILVVQADHPPDKTVAADQ
jgi:predicted PurR-regulated permease PerM